MTRSLLFLPGNTPNVLIHGESLGADAVIYDLEDAVAPNEKDAARLLVRNALAQPRRSRLVRMVRVNAPDGPLWQEDLETILPQKPDAIVLPKAESPGHVRHAAQKMEALEAAAGLLPGSVGLVLLTETALGVERAFDLATADPRVRGLLLGGEDLSADLRCKRTRQGMELLYARGRVVLAARAAGVEAYDTPFTDVDDLEGLREDARFAKGLGFDGKAAISPRHVDIVHEAFSPTDAELAHAREVLNALAAAKTQGKGVASLRGKMIDAPVVKRAERLLAFEEAMREGMWITHE